MKVNQILHGDSLTELKKLPDKSINMCMTSPPYWALRDYGMDGQLGLEPTFDEYINKLCDIFDEVKRVLRDDGTCWVNIGDTYNSHSKSLVMIPFRFAIEMVNRGWILRNTIIWHKRNCMPSSAKDRFTVDFEYLFLFSKNKKYYFETQYEPLSEVSIKRSRYGLNQTNNNQKAVNVQNLDKMGNRFCNPKGRNKRAVWTINPKPFKEAHFAVYPEELCETPIKAGCPKFVCNKCGKIRKKIYEHIKGKYGNHNKFNKQREIDGSDKFVRHGLQGSTLGGVVGYDIFKGYTYCGCNAGFTSGIILDPFFGAGTTGLVALKQRKNFIGIELNPKYIKIAKKRLKPFLEQKTLGDVK